MNCEQIKKQFPDWKTIKPGEWSKHPIILTYGCKPYEYIEVGLYREPMDGYEYEGTYTLQGFNGDEVIFCETVQYQEFNRGKYMDEKSRFYDEISRVLTDYEEFVNGNDDKGEIYERAADMYTVLVNILNQWETVITAQ